MAAHGPRIAERMSAHMCQPTRIGLDEKADFILLFYMVHEVPNVAALFGELEIAKSAGLVPSARCAAP
jgi:hypothetical protein